MNIQRGFRDKIEKYANPNGEIVVAMKVNGNAVYDYCCFGVDNNGKLSDDRYMVFYNQINSPAGEIAYVDNNGEARFTLHLNQLPASINKLVFTVSIDGNGNMGNISSHTLTILQNQQPVVNMTLTGHDFHEEKAIISVEIYRKDVWRFAAVASGFNGGLSDLLRAYGGEESSDDAPAQAQQQAPAYNNPAQAQQQAPAYNNPIQTQQQAPAYNNPAQAQQQAPAYNNPAQAQQQAPAYNNPAQAQQQTPTYGNTASVPSFEMASAYNPAPNFNVSAPAPSYEMSSAYGSAPNFNAAPPAPSYQMSSAYAAPAYNANSTPTYGQNSAPSYGSQPSPAYPQAQSAMPAGAYGSQPSSAYPQAQSAMPAGAAQPASNKISLEKKLQKEAPQLVSLAKPLQVELEKRQLQNCVARVALVLDMSGSMTTRYRNGTVQEIVNKTLPLAVQFDDDGELDFWFYGSNPKRMPSVNMRNYANAVPANWHSIMRSIGATNNEPPVMKEVVKQYKKSRIPAYVLFVTDGGVSSESKIKKILSEASAFPIFWQFVGVGGSNYGILERLDSMTDRYVDNAGFFALDDFRSVSNPELYSRLLNEFPQWLNAVKARGMI